VAESPHAGQPEPDRAPNAGPVHESNRVSDQHITVQELRDVMRQFVRERNWEKFHNAKNLAMSLAIEVGELLEHFQWLTTDEVVAGRGLDRQGIADELADVLCYALSLANALDIDISQAIDQKMVKNRLKYPS
jgi:dCTP diphosphatase